MGKEIEITQEILERDYVPKEQVKPLLKRCYDLLRRYANLSTGGSDEAEKLASTVRKALRQFEQPNLLNDPDFKEGVHKGIADYHVGRIEPWSQVKEELGIEQPEMEEPCT